MEKEPQYTLSRIEHKGDDNPSAKIDENWHPHLECITVYGTDLVVLFNRVQKLLEALNASN